MDIRDSAVDNLTILWISPDEDFGKIRLGKGYYLGEGAGYGHGNGRGRGKGLGIGQADGIGYGDGEGHGEGYGAAYSCGDGSLTEGIYPDQIDDNDYAAILTVDDLY